MAGPDAPRTALVTGANRGIGLAVAIRLHERGLRLIVAARRADEAAAVAARLGDRAVGVALDVTDPPSIRQSAAAAGPVDILVNNAGVLLDRGARPSSVPIEVVQRCLAVNVLGTWRVTQAFLPGMVARGWGRVVMVSSGTGAFSNGLFAGTPAYSLSKAALNALTVMLADETRGTGVLVNAVNPGMASTRMCPEAAQTPYDAAGGIAAAATLPDDGPSGVFLRGDRRIDW